MFGVALLPGLTLLSRGGKLEACQAFRSLHLHVVVVDDDEFPDATAVLLFLVIGQPNQRRARAGRCSADDSRIVVWCVGVRVAVFHTLRLSAVLAACNCHVVRVY